MKLPQFRLRTLLLVVVAFAVGPGYYLHRVERQASVVDWVEKHGGEVLYECQFRDEGYGGYGGGVIVDANSFIIDPDYFSTIAIVDLRDANVSNLKPLYGLNNIGCIAVSPSKISASQIDELRAKIPGCCICY